MLVLSLKKIIITLWEKLQGWRGSHTISPPPQIIPGSLRAPDCKTYKDKITFIEVV